MNELKIFVANRYNHKIADVKYNKYLLMAEVLDEAGSDSWTWDEQDAFEYFIKNKVVDLTSPTTLDWKEFLNEEFISNLLLDFVIKSKRLTLRKIIAGIDETTGLSQGDMKALGALEQLIKKSDDSENNMIYIQYISPIRFGDNDSEAIVKSLEVAKDE